MPPVGRFSIRFSIPTSATASSTTARSRRTRQARRVRRSLATAWPSDQLPRNEQIAFWLNAYNALVLQTVIDHYPIHGQSTAYPAQSIRQIPGAFEQLTHRVGGRTLTLDQIEQTILPRFNDPRVYFAIGRGAVGSGRLRSEAFAPATLETQLAEVAAECASRAQCVQVDGRQYADRQLDLLVAREGVHRRVRRQGASSICAPAVRSSERFSPSSSRSC